MIALLRYRAASLARSQRWLAPVLLYAAFLAVGVRWGQPVLDSLGYAAAGLLPVTAWLVQICAGLEPPAARTVVAAVTGSPRAHLASLLAALGCAWTLGAAAVLAVLLISDPASTDRAVPVPFPPAAAAGLLAVGCCVLLGAVAGALCSRPVLRGRGWSVAATVLAVLLALVTSGSPANSAVAGLVAGSLTGTVHLPVLPFLVSAALAAAVAVLTGRIAALRD